MKKHSILILFMLLVVTLALALTSCEQINEIADKLGISGEEHQHTFGDATCTKPATCTGCDATEGEALGHTEVTDEAIKPTCTKTGLTEGKHCSVCEEVLVAQETVAATGHSYEAAVTAPTCTEGGYTIYTCACGDSYVADETEATGHSYEAVVTAPTCTEGGFTTYTCACGDNYVADETEASGHDYTMTTTVTCTAAGTNTYTCACGDSYTEDAEKLGHVDENLDVDCDREGCTGKVAPAADSVLSCFTANNLGSKLSTSGSYYVIGTIVEVLDQKNGIFLIDDGTGEKFYFRLPKNADGISHANWDVKLTLGDKVSVYGKINKFTATDAPNGQYWPSIQSGLVTVLEQHPHVYTAISATCFYPSYCVCGAHDNAPLGHTDADGDNVCDVCSFGTSTKAEDVKTHYDNIKDTDKVDSTAGTQTYDGVNFTAVIFKGTSSLNSNGTNHMRVQKGNDLTISANNGQKMVAITFVATTSSYVDELQAFLDSTGYTYTTNELEVTILVDSLETLTLSNTSSKVARIATVKIVYTEG